jgi:glycosyltransferase involved in cell wall biosynthesis
VAASPDEPSLSVIVPCYDGADTVGRLVDALLRQDHPAELIFVDDGSADGTAEVVRERGGEGVRVIEHEANRGRAAARNTGIAAASGEVMIFLDMDMEPEPGFVRAHAEIHRDPAVVGAVSNPVLAGLDPDDPYHHYLTTRHGAAGVGPGRPIPFKYFIIGYTSVKAEAIRRVGGLDERVRYGEDLDLAYRLARAYPGGLFFCEHAVVRHRGHGDLGGRLAKLREFGGRSLPLLLSKNPEIASEANLDFVPHPGRRTLAGRVRGLVLRPGLARALGALLPRLPRALRPAAVRYLMASAVAESYRDASRSST